MGVHPAMWVAETHSLDLPGERMVLGGNATGWEWRHQQGNEEPLDIATLKRNIAQRSPAMAMHRGYLATLDALRAAD